MASVSDPLCSVYFGYSASTWSLMLFCFGMPYLLLIASFYLFYAGFHSLQQGVYPPSNLPIPGLKPRTGKVAKLQAAVAMGFPFLAIVMMVVGAQAFSQALDGKDVQTLQDALNIECAQTSS